MFDSLLARARQSIRMVLPLRAPASARAEALSLLTPEQTASFLALSRFDQEHLFCVYQTLQSDGQTETDLLTAGLVHDIGKHDGDARVRFVDRVARVILARFAPELLMSLARPPATGWRSGLVLAVHHAELGAIRARALGFNEQVCMLIRDHETLNDDAFGMLAAMRQADSAC